MAEETGVMFFKAITAALGASSKNLEKDPTLTGVVVTIVLLVICAFGYLWR